MTNGALPIPIYDETFSSWAIRCSLGPHAYLIADHDILLWEQSIAYRLASNAESLGMEFDFEAQHAKNFVANTGFSEQHIKRLFSASDGLVLSPGYRLAFCHKCVLSDVAQKRFPSWRKSWCYVATPYCARHQCLLRYMNGCRDSDKQWSAFTQVDLGEFMPGRMTGRNIGGHGVRHSAERTLLSLRVQTWLHNLYSSNSSVLGPAGQQVDNRLMRAAVDLMLRVLLMHRTRRSLAGVAKTCFSSIKPPINHGPSDLHSRLAHGAINSVPYERMCALWLIGIIFRIFTASEFALFDFLIRDAEFTLPPGLGELGAMCGGILLEGESEELYELISGMDVARVLDAGFLEGLLGGSR